MKYISLNNSSLTVFTSKGRLSELSGSSKYNMFDGEIVRKEKSPNGKIENRSALLDIVQNTLHDKLTHKAIYSLVKKYLELYTLLGTKKINATKDLELMRQIESILLCILRFGMDYPIKRQIINLTIKEQNCRYKTPVRIKKNERTINKSKVKGKMFALFNLTCSKKFMAFYSISFPAGTTDSQAFECLNAWLTALRKRFNLQNYVWVTERQKNETIHFHMLTNNYMPILSINRVMGIIINNKTLDGSMSWGSPKLYTRKKMVHGKQIIEQVMSNPCLDNYNGIDVDSIFDSKRHKKTGKNLNPSQIRQWITAYVTKYVTKNNEKFEHLCWHCSRSISQLFTATLYLWESRRLVTDFLPNLSNMYIQFKSEFNHTCVFKFVPPDNIFELIRAHNDWLFEKFEPIATRKTLKINLKTTTL